jgi:hypothetical protein
MNRRAVAYLICAFAVVGGAVLGSYLLGKSQAPTSADAKRARQQARLVAEASAEKGALQKGLARGGRAGLTAGEAKARRVAKEEGSRDGNADADEQLAAIEAEQAAEAADQLTYDPQLPNGDPGYILPPGQRSVACIGISAETGQCVGD